MEPTSTLAAASFVSGTHAAVVRLLRHPATGAIIASMCALGFIRWIIA